MNSRTLRNLTLKRTAALITILTGILFGAAPSFGQFARIWQGPPPNYQCGGPAFGLDKITPQLYICGLNAQGAWQWQMVSGTGNLPSTVVQTNQSNIFTASPQEYQSNLPSPTLQIICTAGDITTTGPIGGVWCNSQGIAGDPNIDWWDGNFSHALADQFWSACLFLGGCSGTGSTLVTTNGANLSGANINNFFFTTGAGTPSNFDGVYYYYNPNNVPTGFSASSSYSPAVNFAQFIFDTANNGQFDLGESNQPKAAITRTIASGTVAMPTTGITNGSCANGTVTVTNGAAANVLSTDSISVAYQATPTATKSVLIPLGSVGAGAVNVTYCNNTGSSQTMPAVTVNFSVTR